MERDIYGGWSGDMYLAGRWEDREDRRREAKMGAAAPLGRAGG